MAKLAIHGGDKINPDGYKAWPPITQQARDNVNNVLDSGILWGAFAPHVKALQTEWNDYIGSKYCIAVGSGTAALHIAIAGCGIGPGDEVITTALTFIASAHAILQHNAIPIFADIDPRTFNIDPADVERKITKRTRAIIPVHLHGMTADMDAINVIAKKHNLIVIEDACQAHGASYKGVKAGNLGDMAAFSLNNSKNLPGGEGGLFNTNNEAVYIKARNTKDLGEAITEGIERDYNAFEIGWMYRYTEFNAAFARSYLTTLDADNKIRIRNADTLSGLLKEFSGVTPPYIPEGYVSVYHLYRILLDPTALGLDIPANLFRAKVQMALRAEGLEANRWQNRPVPAQELFQKMTGYGKGCPWSCPFGDAQKTEYIAEDYPVTKQVVDDTIVMSNILYPPYDESAMKLVSNGFEKLWSNMDEVLRIETDPESIYMRD